MDHRQRCRKLQLNETTAQRAHAKYIYRIYSDIHFWKRTHAAAHTSDHLGGNVLEVQRTLPKQKCIHSNGHRTHSHTQTQSSFRCTLLWGGIFRTAHVVEFSHTDMHTHNSWWWWCCRLLCTTSAVESCEQTTNPLADRCRICCTSGLWHWFELFRSSPPLQPAPQLHDTYILYYVDIDQIDDRCVCNGWKQTLTCEHAMLRECCPNVDCKARPASQQSVISWYYVFSCLDLVELLAKQFTSGMKVNQVGGNLRSCWIPPNNVIAIWCSVSGCYSAHSLTSSKSKIIWTQII